MHICTSKCALWTYKYVYYVYVCVSVYTRMYMCIYDYIYTAHIYYTIIYMSEGQQEVYH